MKITKSLGLSFLLYAFAATSFPEAVHAEDPAVLDLYGNEVQAGARYVIVAPSTDNTTTLAVTATSKIICNSDVILSTLNESLPIIFSPVIKSKDGVIREGTYLNVNFDAPICLMVGVTTMSMVELSPTTEGYIVTTGGVDRLNQFKITKYEGDNRFYQLSFCPKSEPFGECSCVQWASTVNSTWLPMSTLFLLCLNRMHREHLKWCQNDVEGSRLPIIMFEPELLSTAILCEGSRMPTIRCWA